LLSKLLVEWEFMYFFADTRRAFSRVFIAVILMAMISAVLMVVPASASAVTVKNVAVSKVTSTTAVLAVKADVTSNVTIDFGVAPGVYTRTQTSNSLLRHEVALASLTPSSTVYYRVTITESGNPANTVTLSEKSFHTTRPSGEAFTFGVAGDNRPASNTTVQPAGWNTIVGQMAVENLDLALNVGDIIYGMSTDTLAQNVARWEGFTSATMPLTYSTPLYTVIGNHEYVSYANGKAGYDQELTLPVNNGADAATYGEHYYSLTNGDTHFIALSTEIPGQQGMITGNQRAWLEADLAANTSKWTIVFMHRPLFSGAHAGDPWVNLANAAGQLNKTEIHNLFVASGVDIVFEGHDHYYLRHVQDGIQYIITGGGGAPLSTPTLGAGDVFGASAYEHVKVEETANALRVSAINTAGTTLESFILGVPTLSLAHVRTYWASYALYQTGVLSVDYTMSNIGPGDATDVQLVYLTTSNGVTPQTVTPVIVGNLAYSANASITIDYLVPPGVSYFRASTYAICNGLDGVTYAFPGPAPAV